MTKQMKTELASPIINPDHNWSVYCFTAPNGKRYVGITSLKPEYRWNEGKGYKHNQYLYNAIEKYGWKNIKKEIIANNIPELSAKELEKFYIKEWDLMNPVKGYNKTIGGDGAPGLVRTGAANKNSREGQKGSTTKKVLQFNIDGTFIKEFETMTEAYRETGVHYSKISEVCNGNRRTSGGFMWRFEDIERDNEGNIEPAKPKQKLTQKKVFQYEVDGTLIKTYVSTMEAAKVIGIDNSKICAVCNGRRKTVKGYVFRYEGSDFKGYSGFKPNGFRKKVKKMDLDGEVLEVYNSLSEAARKNKTAPSNIGNCCRGMSKTAIGYKWCFVEEDFKDMMDDYQGRAFNAKPVVQLELDGSFIAEYESAAEAARVLGFNRGDISKVCVGSADSYFGYIWKFLDDYNNGSKNKALRERNVGKKSVLKLSMDGEILGTFKSIKEAADSISVMEPVLNSALNGRIFSTGGFRWTYDEEANEVKNVQEREKVIIKTDIKKVKKYSLSGDFIEEYENIKEAAKTISLTEEAIRKVCKGEAISAGGFAWRYSGEEDYVFREKRYRHKKVKQFTLDGSFLREFKSVKEAASFMKCSRSLITLACNGKLKHGKGFIWKYAEGGVK
ncbi:NUMOD1 domain-containing DNA-binding protein [Bacillus cereus]|uniref:GIY-YIG domain-containing protein n=1 Tax=Bacillus cereus TaxID=1396 RepID=A0A2C1DQC8_BACCE|nr:NUMOD1 domain-containing DNA-binding protein [Bacillus cereus]PGT01860.1 hypothetical protein COD09_14125 [Bacillus cereus]